MPVVPFTNRPSAAPATPRPDDPWLLMAAAQMDAQGRLFHKEAKVGASEVSPTSPSSSPSIEDPS